MSNPLSWGLTPPRPAATGTEPLVDGLQDLGQIHPRFKIHQDHVRLGLNSSGHRLRKGGGDFEPPGLELLLQEGQQIGAQVDDGDPDGRQFIHSMDF